MSKLRLNQPNIQRPSSLGAPSDTAAVILFALGSILAAGWLASEYVAWQLDWNPMFGGWRHYYTPWSFVLWDLQVEAPLQHLFRHAYAIYPSIVTNNLHAAWYVALGAFLSLWIASLLSYRAFLSSRAAENQFDSGGQWATEAVAREDKLLDGNAGPIIGGFATRARTIRPLRYAGELGISYTEPPGGGKSSFLKTNLLIPLARIPAPSTAEMRRIDPWGEEPLVIVSDPKFELLRETSGYQKDVLQKQVLLLAPLGISDTTLAEDQHQIACYNPFWSIRLGTDHAYSDCERLCQAIIDGDGRGADTHWDRTAKAWGAACIEKLGYRAINQGNPEIFSLPGLIDYISSFASLDELLQDMLTTPDDPLGLCGWSQTISTGKSVPTRVKPSIIQAAREMQNKDVRERSGVFSTFITYLSPYRSEMLRKFVTRSTFDWLELANNEDHASIVYISMDPMEIPRLRPYLRMVTSNAIMQLTSRGTTSLNGRSVRTNFRPTVIALDEVAAWRKMPELEHGSGFFRGYGVYLWLIWQSVAQQKKYYGSERLFDETMDVLMYGRPKSADGAKSISDLLGEQTNIVTKRNRSGPRFAVISPHVQDVIDVIKTPMLSTKELLQMARDRYIAFFNGHNYYLHKWEYFRNRSLRERACIPSGTNYLSSENDLVPGFVKSLESSLTVEQIAQWHERILAIAKCSVSIKARIKLFPFHAKKFRGSGSRLSIFPMSERGNRYSTRTKKEALSKALSQTLTSRKPSRKKGNVP